MGQNLSFVQHKVRYNRFKSNDLWKKWCDYIEYISTQWLWLQEVKMI